MKIIIDENIPFIKGRLEPFADVVYTGASGFTKESVKDADALIVRTRIRCDADLLAESKVGLIATSTIGTDHIDLKWCEENGVKVYNAPGCNAPAVAQYVWSSILALGKKPENITLGVIGCGNVGSIVADWGVKLGCKVMICDPPKKEAGKPGIYYPLTEISRECDVITIHTPLTYEGAHPTFHLIGEKELGIISSSKKNTLIINASRGEVVDTKVLIKALESGELSAVIDTWENEPMIDRTLLNEAVVTTPHIAGYSEQGKQRATRMVLEAIDRHFGFNTDKSGLKGDYLIPSHVEADKIESSYNPFNDSEALKKNPENFEKLRHDYVYRKETDFGD